MMILTERFGKDLMDNKCSAIQEYCETCRRKVGVPEKNGISDYQLHEEHLKEQDLLLDVIRRQSKPQFGREVLANIVGSAAFETIRFGLKGLTKIL